MQWNSKNERVEKRKTCKVVKKIKADIIILTNEELKKKMILEI